MNSRAAVPNTLHRGKAFSVLLGMVFAAISLDHAEAVQAPKYLSVPHFQQCLSKQSMGTYDAICLPAARPAQCPAASWRSLRRLSGDQKVPLCGAH